MLYAVEKVLNGPIDRPFKIARMTFMRLHIKFCRGLSCQRTRVRTTAWALTFFVARFKRRNLDSHHIRQVSFFFSGYRRSSPQ